MIERVEREVEGYFGTKEIRKLYDSAKSVSEGEIIVEIGSYRGLSSITFALGSREGNEVEVFSVDPLTDFELHTSYGPEDRQKLYENVAKFEVGDTIRHISASSFRAHRLFDEQNIGLLLIDGDHSYEGALKDWRNFSPLVSDEGIIILDDVDFEGPKRLMEELFEKEGWTTTSLFSHNAQMVTFTRD